MGWVRKPFQGVWNIIRFNWPAFAWTSGLITVALLLSLSVPPLLAILLRGAAGIVALNVLISLAASFFIYDRSRLYELPWLEPISNDPDLTVVNIHAGFDETSAVLRDRFPSSRLFVLDFYEPDRHTEASIRCARKAHPPYPGTRAIGSSHLPLDDASADLVILFMAAHEIRSDHERVIFFKEIHRILKPDGSVFVTEHPRNLANAAAYTFGAYHFLPRRVWLQTFCEADLLVTREAFTSPCVTTFRLHRNGISS